MADNYTSMLATNITNGTTPTNQGDAPFCSIGKTWKLSVLSSLMVLSLVGNVLFTAVFFKNSELRTAVNYFVVNMAISDLVYPVIVLPWRICEVYLDNKWLVGGAVGMFFCKFLPFAEQTTVNVSILSMVLIAVERFHSVLFAMRPTLITVKTCPRIIAVIWLFAIATCAHYFYVWKLVPGGDGKPRCHFTLDTQAETMKAFEAQVILYYICLSAVPWVLLTIMYSSIIFTLFRQKRHTNLASEIVKMRARENRRITCMLVTVLVAFILVWMPHYVNLALFFFAPHVHVPCSVHFTSNYLRYTFTIINPVVYFVLSERYRDTLKQLLSFHQLRALLSSSDVLNSVASQTTFVRELSVRENGEKSNGNNNPGDADGSSVNTLAN